MRLKKTSDVTGITEEAAPSEESLRCTVSREDNEETSDNDTEEAPVNEKTKKSEDTESSEEITASEKLSSDNNNGRGREKPSQPRKPVSTKRLFINLLIKIAVIALIIWVTLTFIFGITINRGNNMHPAVNDGDLIVSLKVQQPYLNAAVLYHHEGKTRAGRVVGLSGNVIDISENGELLIDGSIAAEDIFYPTLKPEDSDILFPYTVEDGKAFILNDCRTDTDDSRSFGAVDIGNIDGPVLFILRRRGF